MTDMSITTSTVIVMTKQNPIYLSESEEEPMEDSYQSSEDSTNESSTEHTEATADHSNDTFVAPPDVTVATPAITPGNTSEQVLAAETVQASVNAPVQTAATIPVAASVLTNGKAAKTHQPGADISPKPTLKRTARMSVRNLTRESLLTDDEASKTEIKNPEMEPIQKKVRLTHLEWMPRVLSEWRTIEGIPSIMETGESSNSSPVSITEEPLEITVPTIVAVVYSMVRMSANRNRDIRELINNANRTDQVMACLHQRMDFVESHRRTDWQSLASIRTRITAVERRAKMTEIVVGIYMVAATMMVAAGFLFC